MSRRRQSEEGEEAEKEKEEEEAKGTDEPRHTYCQVYIQQINQKTNQLTIYPAYLD